MRKLLDYKSPFVLLFGPDFVESNKVPKYLQRPFLNSSKRREVKKKMEELSATK